EAWPAALQTTVIREFESIQKGWFNVHEKSVDLYRQGKLRRFLLLARLIMQDTLRNIAKNAVKTYVE
ncbi:DNAH1, partial [Symbiodinium microadriaticum]